MTLIIRHACSLVGEVLHSWKYKAVFLISLAGYWLLYSLSAGIIQYAPSMVDPVLFYRNPYFAAGDVYNSGMIWLPAKNLQVNLLAGPVLISVLLSILFGLNIVLTSYLLHTRTVSKKLGFAGVLGLAPTFFSTGIACCSAPFGTLVLSTLIPSASIFLVSFSFNSSYALVTNVIAVIAMFLSFLYTAARIMNSGRRLDSPELRLRRA